MNRLIEQKNKFKDKDKDSPSLHPPKPSYGFIYQLMTPLFRIGSRFNIVYEGQFKAVQDYDDPYPTALDFELMSLSFMNLLNQHVYPRLEKGRFAKFTLQYKIVDTAVEGDRENYKRRSINFTLSNAIRLTNNLREGNPLYPKEEIFAKIVAQVKSVGERYDENTVILSACVMTYYEPPLADFAKEIPEEECLLELVDIYTKYSLLLRKRNFEFESTKPEGAEGCKKDRYNRFPSYITRDKSISRKNRFFMVADLETIPTPNRTLDGAYIHTPYACGYMMIDADHGLDADNLAVFYSEDYKILPGLEDDF